MCVMYVPQKFVMHSMVISANYLKFKTSKIFKMANKMHNEIKDHLKKDRFNLVYQLATIRYNFGNNT